MVSLEEGGHHSYKISLADINTMMQDKDMELLKKYGGPEGVTKALSSDSKVGLSKSEADSNFHERRTV